MLRSGFLFFCLLVSSLIATTTIHAQEIPFAAGIACAEDAHTQEKSDSPSGDADKALSHQNGCHGHHISTPAHAAVSDAVIDETDLLLPHAAVETALGSVDPALRPPIA